LQSKSVPVSAPGFNGCTPIYEFFPAIVIFRHVKETEFFNQAAIHTLHTLQTLQILQTRILFTPTKTPPVVSRRRKTASKAHAGR